MLYRRWNNFDLLYQNIINNFTGRTRSYLLSSLIGIFVEHQQQSYSAQLIKGIQEAKPFITDSVYMSFVNKSEAYYLKGNKEFPDSISANTILTPYGSTTSITLNDLLEKHKGKAIYIDFWASWCAPCREDIEESTETKEYLEKNGIVYIYLSTDRNETQWKAATEELNIADNQYLIKNGSDSPLARYLQIIGIPRYVILDTSHKMVNSNAPRPNPYQFSKLKEEISFMTRKVIRYN